MKTRIFTVAILVPALIILTTTPANAIFGSILAGIQRAQMIINQGVQIYEAQIAKLTMDGQLSELTDQFSHLQDQALGSVGAITQPFSDLTSRPAQILGSGLSWKDDFTGVAAELASSVEQMGQSGKSFRESWSQRLTDTDTVTESDIVGLLQDYSPEVSGAGTRRYRETRERGDKRLVLDHAMSDSAANLMVSAREAVEAYEGLTNNSNLSNTALQQAAIAGQVTGGNLTAAMAQLLAFQAAREAAEDYEREIERRERLAEWLAAQQRAQANFDTQQADLDARRDAMREGLLFSPHPFYTDGQ